MRCFHKLFCFGILFFFTTSIYAQQFLVANDAQNIVYVGVHNPLSIIVDGLDCKKLIIKTDNGVIEKSDMEGITCGYTIKPATKGIATILVFKKENKTMKKVGEMYFRVILLPRPEAIVGNIDKDTISKRVLITMGGVRALLTNPLSCADFFVVSYKAIVMRNDSILTVMHNTGGRYNTELGKHLSLMEKDDQVIFSNISVQYPDRSLVVLKPLSYTITE